MPDNLLRPLCRSLSGKTLLLTQVFPATNCGLRVNHYELNMSLYPWKMGEIRLW